MASALVIVDAARAAVVVVVAGDVGEGPVGRAAGHVGEAGAEVQPGRVSPLTPVAVPVAPWAVAVIDAGVAVDRDRGVGLADHDGDRAAVVVVVAGHVGEGPVGRAAGHVGEAGAQVQAGAGSRPSRPSRAGGAVGVAVIDAGVAGDRRPWRRPCVIVDGDRAAGVVVVAGDVGEGPVAVPPGTLVKLAPRSSPARVSPLTPVAVPVAPWASPSYVSS